MTTPAAPAENTAEELTEEGVKFFVANTKQILSFLVNATGFRHEGEANRLLFAVENITKDVEEALRGAEPVSPTAGGVDPMLAAVMKQNDLLTSQLGQLLDAVNSGKLVVANPAPVAEVPTPAQVAPAAVVETVAPVETAAPAPAASASTLLSALAGATAEPVDPPENLAGA